MQLATTVAYISVDRDVTTTDQPGVTAAGVQEPVSQFSGWEMHILWTKHCSWHGTPRIQLSLGLGTVVAVPGVMVYSVEWNFPELHCTVMRAVWNAPVKINVAGISTLFNEHGAQLVHHYRVIVSQYGLFMIDLLYFTNRVCTKA